MAPIYFSQPPQNILLSIGGFTCVRPGAWNNYLSDLIQNRYPQYHANESILREAAVRSLENGCILESLEKYLFKQFGTALPQENLFKFYNPNGEGISPAQMLEAIAAVIEPMGFEIESVLATDKVLQHGLGWQDRVFGLEKAQAFHGKPGICMINIEDGYSHAFYWEKMDQAKFLKKQFRIAILVKRSEGEAQIYLSASEGLEAYCRLISGYTNRNGQTSQFNQAIKTEAVTLNRYIQKQPKFPNSSFRKTVERHLTNILALFENNHIPQDCPDGEEAAALLEAGRLLRRVLLENEAAHFAIQS